MNLIRGNPGSKSFRIGTLTTLDTRKLRRGYETASWYTEVECPPQTVELLTNGYYLFYKLEGTVSDEHFVNRLFHASSVAEKRNIGKSDSITSMPYLYELWRLMESENNEVTLDDGIVHEIEVKDLSTENHTHIARFSRLYQEG